MSPLSQPEQYLAQAIRVPFVYSLQREYDPTPLLFPSLIDAVKHLIANGASAAYCRNPNTNPVRAHYWVEGGSVQEETVDVSSFTEQQPVDEDALRAERDAAVAKSRAKFDKVYPNGRPVGQVRASGDHWLCESSPEELESMLRQEIERRSWVWKDLSSV